LPDGGKAGVVLSPDQAAELPGVPVLDPVDEELGTVEEVYLDAGDDQPQWVAVAMEEGRAVVPLDGAEFDGEGLRIRYPRELVIEAVDVHVAGAAIDPDAQAALYAHYGITDSDLRDDTGWASDRPDG
jgi:hypothetical protein